MISCVLRPFLVDFLCAGVIGDSWAVGGARNLPFGSATSIESISDWSKRGIESDVALVDEIGASASIGAVVLGAIGVAAIPRSERTVLAVLGVAVIAGDVVRDGIDTEEGVDGSIEAAWLCR